MSEGITATDLVLRIVEMLRKQGVVGKFVEFYGEGASSLPLPDRATIANMAPEYGATMGYFPVDDEAVNYLRATGRTEEQCSAFEAYFKAQEMFGMPRQGEIDYTVNVDLDLSSVQPGVAGPKRPQDRINLPDLKKSFDGLLERSVAQGGYNKPATQRGRGTKIEVVHPRFEIPADEKKQVEEMEEDRPTADPVAGRSGGGAATLDHGSVVIAAITSCTNTSNPSVMLGAGLLAKRAVEKGLTISPSIKTSLAPGSRVVQDYLASTGLQPYLDQLGFQIVGYGCTTCIGNSGPLPQAVEEAITTHDLVAASVLSGNRNFEARVHQNVKANFLMSPPLVVAFALAGKVDIDLTKEPLGQDKEGEDVYLRDLWPTLQEIREAMEAALKPEIFQRLYRDFSEQNPKWNEIPGSVGQLYPWEKSSTYIQHPPFFKYFSMESGTIANITGARPLGIFGDSVTTDHVSPAGAIKADSPAGRYLVEHGVEAKDFNSYGSRRGNDQVMTRGTFANVRIKNLMVPGVEGGVTKHFASGSTEGEQMDIYDAAVRYKAENRSLIILAGQEYGTGSSRDWAAKGTMLLGVKAVVAQSYERIHRSNLVGMGVLPLQFEEGTSAQSLALNGSETYDVLGLSDEVQPRQMLTFRITRGDGSTEEVPVVLRIDTPIEVEYYRHGGILPFVLRELMGTD